MTRQSSTQPGRPLTSTQHSRIEFARRDLDSARAKDLAQLEAADLVLLVERLRNRLGDALDLIDELSEQHP